jgi:hypothetical protein
MKWAGRKRNTNEHKILIEKSEGETLNLEEVVSKRLPDISDDSSVSIVNISLFSKGL